MQRISETFQVSDILKLKQQMLNWCSRFSICCFMDSHDYIDKYHQYDCLVAVNAEKELKYDKNFINKIDHFYSNNNDWIFGHFGYDLKNDFEDLNSSHQSLINFDNAYLFIPTIVLILNKSGLTIQSIGKNPSSIFDEICAANGNEQTSEHKNISIKPKISKEEYIKTVNKLLQHIKRGDCYEINYCQEFFAKDADVCPANLYLDLLKVSPTPFSCFYRVNEKYLLCASPERFLSKINNEIYSQPIKGTASRSSNKLNDNATKINLFNDEKERSENVMITDLVRNDLSKICKEGSVQVEELFGVYSFPQVHQMISTIKGNLDNNILFSDILKATFPMGSMTGAPKLRSMQLIEEYEKTKRSLFAGSVGYISPDKNFDFNVVIRSIFYNSKKKYLNYLVGSAITFYSDGEKEYEECLLKAKAIKSVI